ncbi:PqqD family protein [Lihuaxuella thermophila]|uniref:Coenzyme PQQ synthesis protein D (PqqD) n=1 Tax=Lihuaxuella thermophila TaxID=1173111 RepID=A0A1H8GXF0_9BACL|nr:PqqD family protein [Lihuaxuella thermophila]SEN48742.1 Coenzyme PQQ synthesis protein D (PqqD) [Lihuaxuella thermophila]
MRLSIPEYIQIREIDGQWVLLDCRQNRFYAVNKTGAEFLEQVKVHGEMAKAIGTMSKVYQIPYEKVEQDMQLFIHRLIEKELVMNR